MTLDEYQSTYNDPINWTEYLNGINIITKDFLNEVFPFGVQKAKVYVKKPMLVKKIIELVGSLPLRNISDFLQWKFIKHYVPSKTQREVRDQCKDKIVQYYPHLLDRLYIDNFFDKSAIPVVEQMFGMVKQAFEGMLKSTAWLDSNTQHHALEKLQRMKLVVGHFPEIYNDSALAATYVSPQWFTMDASDTYTENCLKADYWHKVQSLALVSKPVTGYKVSFEDNAYYDAQKNTVYLLAAALRPLAYNDHRHVININFGGMGFTMGHEIGHGFDQDLAGYDAYGTERSWWSVISWQHFEHGAECFVEQYGGARVNLTTEEGSYGFVDGQRTLNENIADNAGLNAALQAMKHFYLHSTELGISNQEIPNGVVDHSDSQQFFFQLANEFCGNGANLQRTLEEEEHSPNSVRVNYMAMNSEEFAEAFNCSLGSPMNPRKKCKIW